MNRAGHNWDDINFNSCKKSIAPKEATPVN